MRAREAIDLVLGDKATAQSIALEAEKSPPTPNDKTPTPGEKPFPGAKTPFDDKKEAVMDEEGYKPNTMNAMGPLSDPTPSPSPSPKGEKESMQDFLNRMFEKYGVEAYGITGGEHNPDTQSPETPHYMDTPTPDDSPGEVHNSY